MWQVHKHDDCRVICLYILVWRQKFHVSGSNCDDFILYLINLCYAALISFLYEKLAASSFGPSSHKLGPNGTLTLGAAHHLVNGNVQVIPSSTLSGKLSLFRLWGREHSQEEVTSLRCTEGDLVRWNMDDWHTHTCHPLPDSSLHCGEPMRTVLHITLFLLK